MWHILEPDSTTPGQYCSIDYVDSPFLTMALDTLRSWRWSLGRTDLALAKGRNGEALHYVVYTRPAGEPVRALSAHRTALGAKRAFLKYGRSQDSYAALEYGWQRIAEW